ncbi:MAG TPA: M28 family peptidase [Vicinamibacterales bacterium]|nr:M28 family peptidase [Vicinamibacterales bacterium]
MRCRIAVALSALLVAGGCSRAPALFSEQNARAHVEMLAGTIGSRPTGSAANARARAYILDQLKLYGYEVRVQQTDARRPDIGRTARVANIIGILPGQRPEAIGLVSHYDTRADTPGAADDAFGVAVSLEAARVIASRPARRWTTFVLVTDAEEMGLMGAAALMNDPQVRDHLSAYVNVEAIGSSAPSVLFETGPGNGWLVGAWARAAPRPRGGSYAIEIYERLPNDTDFSILARHDVPGLNFAIVGDSYSYHTSRDTAERLSSRAIRDTGQNVVGILEHLQEADITARTDRGATYFDIGGTVALSYAAPASWITSALALVLGMLAWLRVTRFLLVAEGAWRWLLGLLWTMLGAAAAAGAMVFATWALRATREAYHPWYAAPDRLFLLLAATGAAAAWMMARAGRWIPARARGLRHPAVAWTYALPAWMALTAVMLWNAPAASYLWTVPLLCAGLLLVVCPVANSIAMRLASLIILVVVATLWLPGVVDLLRFMVGVFGRQPIVTPVFVYAALIAVTGIMIVPPLFAATGAPRPLVRPSIATALLLALVAASGASAWLAPAYTEERPLRRFARAVQEPGVDTSIWQVSSLEPGLDLGEQAPSRWSPAAPAPRAFPVGAMPQPFVFSTTAPALGPPPVSIANFTIASAGEGTGATLRVAVLPAEPSLTVTFVLPAGLEPARSNLPGVRRTGRWTTTYMAPPPEGIAWEATFAAGEMERLRETRVVVTAAGLPGGDGWERLPTWLPRERAVWSGWTTWILDPTVPPPIPPVPPLR